MPKCKSSCTILWLQLQSDIASVGNHDSVKRLLSNELACKSASSMGTLAWRSSIFCWTNSSFAIMRNGAPSYFSCLAATCRQHDVNFCWQIKQNLPADQQICTLSASSRDANSTKIEPLKSLLMMCRRKRTALTGASCLKKAVRSSKLALYGRGATYRLRSSACLAASSREAGACRRSGPAQDLALNTSRVYPGES